MDADLREMAEKAGFEFTPDGKRAYDAHHSIVAAFAALVAERCAVIVGRARDAEDGADDILRLAQRWREGGP